MTVRASGRLIAIALFGLLLGGCMAAKKPAPVVDRSPEGGRAVGKAAPSAPRPATAIPETYVVRRGDTLRGIALERGLDYRDLVRWNGISNPNSIEVGQVLWLRRPDPSAAGASPQADASGGPVATPFRTAPPVAGREVTTESNRTGPGAAADAASEPGVLTSPKATKLPYSESAVASLKGSAAEPQAGSSVPDMGISKQGEEADAVAWSWPTKGRIVANFNENGGPKGLQIAGELGQPVLASAAGRVVYTGSGLRGYGNLVIIKHNNTFLSAYAHNRQILVKQGDQVARGQRIAEMGNSDTDRVMLHFEIRREGKPVDPTKYLPPS